MDVKMHKHMLHNGDGNRIDFNDISLESLGGYCTDGFALIDVMELSNNPIKTVGLGQIVSMGVLIACAGTKGSRYMTKKFNGHGTSI